MNNHKPGWMDKQKWIVIHWDIEPEERHIEGINTLIEHFTRMGIDVKDRIATKAIVAEVEYDRWKDSEAHDKSKGKWFGDQVQMQVVLTEDEIKIVKDFCDDSIHRPKDMGIHHPSVLGVHYFVYLSNSDGTAKSFGEEGQLNPVLNNTMSACHTVHLSCELIKGSKDEIV